jgi:dTDP-4-dehydrorhamnose reductase
MRILVTGAGGMLGRDVVAAAREHGHEVAAAARADLDVTDAGAVREALAGARPAVVVNCAAWTDVDGAESEPGAAAAVNATGAGNVAAGAAAAGARVLHVSTDYVFDGAASRPYVESDPVGPRSVYGHTKLAGERAVAAADPRHQIVRTSWLFGLGGPNFVATMLRLAGVRDEVAVVTDQVGCPTWTGHLAEGLVRLAGSEDPGIHHLAGSGHCSWHAFAREIFRQAGVPCEVRETDSSAFPRPAPRPAWSVLGTERSAAVALPDWREGLAAFLAERARAREAAGGR